VCLLFRRTCDGVCCAALCRYLQCVEIVLTAHPTQVNRRTLQYKHSKIAVLLQQHDRYANTHSTLVTERDEQQLSVPIAVLHTSFCFTSFCLLACLIV
jgi:phosphoenolpyruvate carboxylase